MRNVNGSMSREYIISDNDEIVRKFRIPKSKRKRGKPSRDRKAVRNLKRSYLNEA